MESDTMSMVWLIDKTIEEENLSTENESDRKMHNDATRTFQSNAALSKRLKDRLNSIVVSNDGYFMMCAAQKSTQTKDIVLVFKSKNIVDMSLSFACNQKAKFWLWFMSKNSDTAVLMKAAENLLFSLRK